MIYSMTAFSRAQAQGSWGSAVCELRSVNHRYLDVRVHLPDALFELEQPINEHLRAEIKRGKVECYFRFHPGEGLETDIQINLDLAKKIIAANEKISENLATKPTVNSMEVLRWPGVLQVGDTNIKVAQKEIMALLATAVKQLLEVRAREGEDLKQLFLQRLDGIGAELAKVKTRLPSIMQHQRDRLSKRFEDAQIELDKQRLEQEMVMLAQKIDIAEELDRLETHTNEVRRVLKEGGLIGRRLDFLMQELNREANTLGAKSVDVETTHASLEMKVLIEQLREQMQNIE